MTLADSTCRVRREDLFLFILVIMLIHFITLAATPASAQTLQKIKIGIPAVNVLTKPFFIGQDLGFFRQEGLDAEFPFVRPELGAAGLVKGEIDYFASGDTTLRAAAGGLPVKLIFAMADHGDLALVVRSDIQKGTDLKGKKIAVASPRTLPSVAMMESARRYGLDPLKDIFLVSVGDLLPRYQALQAGAVDGMVVDTALAIMARNKGYKILDPMWQWMDLVQIGLGVNDRVLKQNPDFVYRTLKASLRSLVHVRTHSAEMIKAIQSVREVNDEEAKFVYDIIVQNMTANGIPSNRSVQVSLDAIKADNPDKKIPTIDEVVDFGLLRRAQRELGIKAP
ncbi:MAG: ABC transporter substrate-binding protein [Candidatus Tectomicrobia bacterium]|uniref:ABC transporter substrate-binding protein n=1 Tax=Tectimicrobiota bacterium TaxID=2528274 RepID=A0A932GMF5_UNCTE|nr:ABC transporter substrate-binding protein [Candidatus Tectomicrobia bacterium]